ncbi:MAG: hypothetical protein KF726_21890 [Anaerolineae bacterium]|nr:hypothetical protein [Anaerolineae bacterium]
MASVFDEIVDGVRHLDEDKQYLLLDIVRQLNQDEGVGIVSGSMGLSNWVDIAESTRRALSEKYNKNNYFNSVDLLNEAREERLDDLMGRG